MSSFSKVRLSDEFRNLLEAEEFEGTNWEAILGTGFANLLTEISGVNGTNKLSDRINDAVLQVDSFFGSNISKIISDEFYSETLQSNLNVISASDINFDRLDASLISFGNERYEFSITGDNFNSNLLTLMQLAKSGSRLDEIIADGIDGQVSSFKFVDKNTNVQGASSFSVSINTPNLDANSKDAETLIVDVNGAELELSGSFPRDISSIYDWLNSGLSLEALAQQENSNLTGIAFSSPTGRKISIDENGLFLEVPYVSNMSEAGEEGEYIVRVNVETSVDDILQFSAENLAFDNIHIEDLSVLNGIETLLNDVSLSTSNTNWVLEIDEATLLFEGDFEGLNRLGNVDGDAVIHKASLTTNGNALINVEQTPSLQDDGSSLMGDNIVFDLTELSSGVVQVNDSNIIGTSYDDVLVSEVGGVYLAGGAGDDSIGFVSPYWGEYGDAAVLVGGDGADKFYISASAYMPPIEIYDFNPNEGDQIEISPSFAIYQEFQGYEIVDGGISLNFATPTSVNRPDSEHYNSTDISITPGEYAQLVETGSSLYWHDDNGGEHHVSSSSIPNMHSWTKAAGNKILIAYAENDNSRLELKIRVFNEETSSFEGAVISYPTSISHMALLDMQEIEFDYRHTDPEGLKFSVRVSAEDMDQGHYINETFNLEVNSTDISITPGEYAQLVETGSSLYWHDDNGGEHHVSSSSIPNMHSWTKAAGNKILIAYAENDNSRLELKIRVFNEETSSFEGAVISYPTSISHMALLDMQEIEFDYRHTDPEGLKFSVRVSAEDMDQGHYINETFNLEVNSTDISITPGEYAQLVETGSSLYWHDDNGGEHHVSSSSIPNMHSWTKAAGNKILIAYAENDNSRLELKIRVFNEETSSFEGAVISYPTSISHMALLDMQEIEFDYRHTDPEGLKFSVRVSAEDMDQGHYINETFNLEVNGDTQEYADTLDNEEVRQVKFSNFDQSIDYTQYIKITDTTADLGVFELGDGDTSQAQWGQAYNSSETVYGSRWDDDIVGGDADQKFITFSGSDSIDGAGGVDTLAVDKNFSDIILNSYEIVSSGTMTTFDGEVGFSSQVDDLIWRSADDPDLSIIINDTKPTDNSGNPGWINGYQYKSLESGNIAVIWNAATLKTVNGNTDGIQDVYARVFNPLTGEFVTDEINITEGYESQYINNVGATAGGSFWVSYGNHAGPMGSAEKTALVQLDGSVEFFDGEVGFSSQVDDLIWRSADDPDLSIIINDTKPTDNSGNPGWINGYQYKSLESGNIAVIWNAATLKTVNGNTDGIQDVYARVFNPLTGEFVTDEINITEGYESQYINNVGATAGGSFWVSYGNHAGPMGSAEKTALVQLDGSVEFFDGEVGFSSQVDDLIWRSADDPDLSIIINDTKPTDNSGNPGWINGYQYKSLESGNIAVIWNAATLKTVNGNTDGIQDVYARVFNPLTGEFVTDEINITEGYESQYINNVGATAGGSFWVSYGNHAGPMGSAEKTALVNLNTEDGLEITDRDGSFVYQIKNTEFVEFNDQTLSFNELMEPFSQKSPSINLISTAQTINENTLATFTSNKLMGFSLDGEQSQKQSIAQLEIEIYFSDEVSGKTLPFEFELQGTPQHGISLFKTGIGKYRAVLMPGNNDVDSLISEFFSGLTYSSPEDLAGSVKGHIGVRNKNSSNDWSDWNSSEFNMEISPVAEVPVAEIEALSDLNHDGKADNHPNFYVNKDVLLKFNLKASDLDGSEKINSVRLVGLKDEVTDVQKGSIVDIDGNTLGTVTSAGFVEFSDEEIISLVASTNTSSNNAAIYFRPAQDFAGEVELTIEATSIDGESISDVSSSSTIFKIQDADIRFEYLTFSLDEYNANIYFAEEVKLQYEIDETHTQFLKEAVVQILNESSSDPEVSYNIRGGGSGAFRSEENYNAALEGGDFTVYERYRDENGNLDERAIDLPVPTYSELQAKVRAIVDNITFEKDTIVFEAGSYPGADDNIILSVPSGERFPSNLRLIEVYNDWNDGDYSSVKELHFSQSIGRDVTNVLDLNDAADTTLRGVVDTNATTNYLTFSLDEYNANIYFAEEVKLQYEIDETHTQFLKEAVVQILNESSSDPEVSYNIRGGGSGAFRSEENYNAALEGGDFTVYERYRDENGNLDERAIDLPVPTYSELQAKVRAIVDNITFEKDTIVFEAGSYPGADDNIILSVPSGERFPSNLRLIEVYNDWNDGDYSSVKELHFSQSIGRDVTNVLDLNDAADTTLRGVVDTNATTNYLTFSLDEYNANIYFAEEVKLQYEIDETHTQFLKEAVVQILNESSSDPEVSYNIRGGGSGAFRSEENYNAALEGGDFTVYERYRDENGNLDERAIDLPVPTYSELQAKVRAIVDNITFEKDTIVFEAGSYPGADDNIILSVPSGERFPSNLRLIEVYNDWNDGDYSSVKELHFSQSIGRDVTNVLDLNDAADTTLRGVVGLAEDHESLEASTLIELSIDNQVGGENTKSTHTGSKLSGLVLDKRDADNISHVEIKLYFSDANNGEVLPFDVQLSENTLQGAQLSELVSGKIYKITILPGMRDLNSFVSEVFNELTYSSPEDLAGFVKGHVGIRNKNSSNGWSDWSSSEFNLEISPVAEVPVAEIEALSDLNHDGQADNHPNFYVNKDVLLKFNLKASDLDGSEKINSVRMVGLKDELTDVQKGSIVDIDGNSFGNLTSAGVVEFSDEEITSLVASTNTSSNNAAIYFRPAQDFVGEVELKIEATSIDGESISDISSSSANFEIQDGEISLEYISFSLSDYSRDTVFRDEVKLQYEIDAGHYDFWHAAAGKILEVSHPDRTKLRLTGWEDDYFISEASYNAAISSGKVKVQEALWDNAMEEWTYQWDQFTDITPPSYADIKSKVDEWLTSVSFEKDSIVFEAGSSIGPDDNIILSIVEGDEVPSVIYLHETNLGDSPHGLSNLSFRVNEVFFNSEGELRTTDDGSNLHFQQGVISSQSEKNMISFSLSDYSRDTVFRDEVKLQYEIDAGHYDFWHAAAGKILEVSHPDRTKLRLTGWEDDYFISEASYNAAISSGKVKVQEALWDNAMEEWTYQWDQFTDITPPSYADIKSKVDEWLTSVSFEKDSIVFEAGSSIGPDDNIILSIVEGDEVPSVIYLHETNLGDSPHGLSNLSFRVNEVFFNSEGELRTTDDGSNLHFQQGVISSQSEKNMISFSLSDYSRDTVFRDEVKLQYEIDAGHYDFWHAAAGKILEVSHPDRTKLRLTGWEDDYFISEASYNAAISSGKVKVQEALWDNAMEEWTYQWDQFTDITPPSYADIKSKVDEWLTSVSFEKDSIVFEAGSSIGPDDNIILSIVEGDEVPSVIYLHETNLGDSPHGLSNLSFRVNEVFFNSEGELRTTDDGSNLHFQQGVLGLPENDDFYLPVLLTAIEDTEFTYQIESENSEAFETLDLLDAPNWVSLDIATMTISGTPLAADTGNVYFKIMGRYSDGTEFTENISLSVQEVNDLPKIYNDAPATASEDELYIYKIDFSDEENDRHQLVISFDDGIPTWLSYDVEAGELRGMPLNENVGVENFIVYVTDLDGGVFSKNILLTVNNTNDAPIIEVSDSDGALADAIDESAFSYQLGVTDVDVGDSHIFRMTSDDDISWLSLDAVTGLLTGAPDDEQVGVYNITFSVEDAAGVVSTSDAISLTVQNINDPVYIDDAQTSMFRSDIENVYQIQISDEDLADSYSFTANNLPSWMSLDASTGVLSGSPTRTDDGSYNVEVTVTDGGGLSDTKVIEITATSFEYSVLGSGDDLVFGDADRDHISTGGGNDKVYSGANDDVVIVQGQGDVEVDTGSGDDRVVVEDGWSGTLFVKNGAGSNILEILGNQEDMDVGFVDGKVQLTIGNGSAITIDEQFVMNSQTGKVELSENGFEYIKTYGYDANGNALAGEYAYASYFVLGSEEDNLLIANQPSDAEANDEVFIMAGDGADIIEGNASNLMIEGGRGDDLIRIAATSGNKSVFGDIFTGDSGGNVHTQNSSYSDVVELDWSYDASEITQIGSGYRIYNDDLDATVDIYDVEILKFANDDGTWDTRYLTDGAPIGPGDFDVPAGTDVNYGDGSSVRFVLTDNSISSSEGKSSWLQVYAQVTETHMVEESYFTGRYVHNNGKSRSTPRSGYKPEYKTREVEQSTESEKLVWEGDKTSVDAFTFSDGVVVNVINVADKDWNDQPIEMTLGTDGIDLIFGNDSDNLIDAGLGDDIIFGGDGDDVIIGGEGDDILLGGDGDDIIRGDTVTDQDVALEHFAELTNYDDSQLSIDNSDMGTGGDDVILGGDGIDDIDSGDGTNLVSSGRMDLDGDGEADLDIVKDFMEDNNIDNKDIFDNDDWV